MENQALMEELVSLQKKQLTGTRILIALAGVILAAITVITLVYAPKLKETLIKVETMTKDVDVLMKDVDELVVTNTDSVTQAVEKINELVSENSDSLSETIKNVNQLVTDNSDSLTEALDNINELVSANTDSVTEALDNINKVDFDQLNTAIKNLSDVIEPLANFFNKLPF